VSVHVGFEPIQLPFDFVRDDFEKLMVTLSDIQSSDITIVTGRPIMIKLHGKQLPATVRALQEGEVRKILEWMYGSNAVSEIARRRALNMRYEIQLGNNTRIAFRMNAVGILSSRGNGQHITLRAMPRDLPRIEDMSVPAEIVESINIGKGCFAVVGETGSGKSTLLTSMMNYINSACENRKVVTFEAPIEFDMTSLKSSSNMIIQCEIGEHLPSFYDGVKEALRQGPTDILIGEARDKETILAMLQAAESGHAAYVTVHAESVRTTFTRIAQEFDTAVFAQTIFKLITQLRVVVCQRLAVPIKPGRRVPIREWLVLDAALRQRLLRMPAMDALNEIEIEIERQGQSYPQQAMIAYKKGLISATELTKYVGDEAVSLPEVWDGEVPA